ncbi:MAG: UTP--glucose-1-phosphate uridylyltransferase [Rhizobiales bacterium]|nr:UTP--glucose-1-phosphate uridylyltransferase [Hyphomicrobiales bacterium]
MNILNTTSARKVRKAVFPVAGLGTRLLPATKAMPKEMLTVVDRPLIQLAVDEAREAGIEHFIFVTGRNKEVIENHFDQAYELEDTLHRRGKVTALEQLALDRIGAGRASFTRQQAPLGLGHAVACARDLVGDEPFAVILPDMVMHANPGCLKQMMDVYDMHGGNIIASEAVPDADLHRYGVLGLASATGNVYRVDSMVEKPAPGRAPSNQIISGRYILQPEIFNILDTVKPGAGGEIQLTDALIEMLARQAFHAVRYEGKTYDCGDRLGFILANLAFGLSRPDLGKDLRQALIRMLSDMDMAGEEIPQQSLSHAA